MNYPPKKYRNPRSEAVMMIAPRASAFIASAKGPLQAIPNA